jgi:hypothetical protein
MKKRYEPHEVAAKVLDRVKKMYNLSKLAKGKNSAHEIELEKDPTTEGISEEGKDKKKVPEHEQHLDEEGKKLHDSTENETDEEEIQEEERAKSKERDEQDADNIEEDEEEKDKNNKKKIINNVVNKSEKKVEKCGTSTKLKKFLDKKKKKNEENEEDEDEMEKANPPAPGSPAPNPPLKRPSSRKGSKIVARKQRVR